MIGKVISIGKDFGFIHDEKGNPYYFNRASLNPGVVWKDVVIGDAVEFISKPGPKGMMAINVSVQAAPYKPFVKAEREIISKKENPFRHDELFWSEFATVVESSWCDSHEEADSQIINAMRQLGGNCFFHILHTRRVFQDGNYKYGKYTAAGWVGTYFKEIPMTDMEQASSVHEASLEKARISAASLKAFSERTAETRAIQENGVKTPFIIYVVVFVALIGIAFNFFSS